MAAAKKFSNPRGVPHISLSICQISDSARDASARVEAGEWNIQLLEAMAKHSGQDIAEWSKETAPFRPRLEFIFRSVFVEVPHLRCYLANSESRTTQAS